MRRMEGDVFSDVGTSRSSISSMKISFKQVNWEKVES